MTHALEPVVRIDSAGGAPGGITGRFGKAVGMDMLPKGLPLRAQFQAAVSAGFEAIEMESVAGRGEAEEVLEASRRSGLAIHSVLTIENWRHPLSSGDAAEVGKSVGALRTALENARLWGADTVLVVPAMVDAATSYGEAYTRSQTILRNEVLPVAAELGIVLGIENVWNGLLLSPLEYVRYIDELESPWVRAYLDVGNMFFGHPEHWVRIAGSRIVKLHLKDFRLDVDRCRFSFSQVGEGAVDWSAVRSALTEVGFSGYITSTGIPRDRLLRWMSRASAVSELPGVSLVSAALRRRAESAFLGEVSHRFDGFCDGGLC